MNEDVKNEHIESVRHSLAHVLAMAVLKRFPGAKLGIGPVIENGFYYDFLLPEPISEEDLSEFQKTMKKICSQNLEFTGEKVTAEKARTLFAKQPFKLELINDFANDGKELTVYATGPSNIENLELKIENYFVDLCRGGHIGNTKEINTDGFKLTKIAGAYWRGDEKNQQLIRIYGLAFATKEELAAHLAREEEAKKRDHRKLGKELELFTIVDEVGPGLPLFYPRGALLRRLVEEFISELQERRGYLPIWIPHITKGELYKISGHLDKYDAMYPPMELAEEASYYLKPMNCPHFMMLFRSTPHSYKDLPIRWTATTTNYRFEKSGELSGLTRVRSITQDDCHVFASPDQINLVINEMLDMISETYQKFGFNDFWVRISTADDKHPEKYLGSPEVWSESEAILKRLVEERGWKHEIGEGEAAFYGPKLDFIFKDVLSREWQLSTIQLDMNLPKRFGLEYTDSTGGKATPILIHRAILGSTERFLGILIEHYGGAFPLWLSPVQIGILTVNDTVKDYAESIAASLRKAGFRVEMDDRNESIGKKIREGEMQKTPYLLVIGGREAETTTVAVRRRGKEDLGVMKTEEFIELLNKENPA